MPWLACHLTQRGNRRERIFFNEGDYAPYRDLLAETCKPNGIEVWSWYLMPNHVHLILVPAASDVLGYAPGEAHRRYSGCFNAQNRQTGHLFQGRHASVAMDEAHLLAAACYVALNPGKARLDQKATDWRWSSARAHLSGNDDELVKAKPLLDRITNFAEFLDDSKGLSEAAARKRGLSVGRPLMDTEASERLEVELGRPILLAKRGRKPRSESADAQRELENG